MFIISLSRWLGSLTLEQPVIHKGGRGFVHVTARQTILIVMLQIPCEKTKKIDNASGIFQRMQSIHFGMDIKYQAVSAAHYG
jgi:hypothetical protein